MIRFRLTLAYRKRHLIPRWVKTKMCPHTFKLSVPIIWIGYDKAMNKIQISKFSTRFLTWILGKTRPRFWRHLNMQDQWTFAVWFSNSFSGKLVSLVTLSADFPRAKKMHSHAEDGCTKFCFCIFAKKIPASRNKNVHIFSLANFKIISLKFCLSEIWFNAVSLPL